MSKIKGKESTYGKLNGKEKVCQCLKCNNVFNIDNAKIVKKCLYGILIDEKRCPICEGEFRQICVKDYIEMDRDHWFLHNCSDEVKDLWAYYTREN